jgi:predicted phage terminase large subunit-like protein
VRRRSRAKSAGAKIQAFLANLPEMRARCESDLESFAKAFWTVLEPSTELRWNWHLTLLCEYLTQVARGECRRLIVNVPPRTMKSLLCTVLYPAWRWTTAPERRFMCVSYADELSEEHSVFRRAVLNDRIYRAFWGERVRLSGARNQRMLLENRARGAMFATSITGAATGKGCDELIVDDPQNPKKAFSDVEREATNRCFDMTFRSRHNQPASGSIVIVMQRLHDRDLTGHVLAQEPGGWTHLKLPAEAEHDERWIHPLSRTIHVRRAGQLLWPERLPADVLRGLKTALGSWAYSGQYQQNPAPQDGGIVKRAWLRHYRELPAEKGQWLQSWDCAFKDTRDSDFVVGQTWFVTPAAYYLVDQVRERMDFVATVQAIRRMSALYPRATAKLVENKANGPAVLSALRREIDGLIGFEPKDSKAARLNAVSPLFEAGNVFIPERPWTQAFVEELTRFPNAANDDQVDACTQALLWSRERMRGIMQFYRQQAERAAGR